MKYVRLNNKGQSLLELAIGLGIGAIVSLSIATVFSFGVDQFNLALEQNRAEENLLQASYLTRVWFSQAVKTDCYGVATVGGAAGSYHQGLLDGNSNTNSAVANYRAIPTNFTPASGTALMSSPFPSVVRVPDGISPGVVNCGVALPSAAAADLNTPQPLGIFVRDNSPGTIALGGSTASNYLATGIYFLQPANPPTDAARAGNTHGVLYFMQADETVPGSGVFGPLNPSASGVFLDHLVSVVMSNVKVSAGSNIIQSMDATITARYYKSTSSNMTDYRVACTGPVVAGEQCARGSFRDVAMTIPIGFRNNWLGVNPVMANTSERLHGAVYYYNFVTPFIN